MGLVITISNQKVVFCQHNRKFEEAKRDNLEAVTCWGSGLPKEGACMLRIFPKPVYVFSRIGTLSKDSPHNENNEKLLS